MSERRHRALPLAAAVDPPPDTMRLLGVEFERLWTIERHILAFGTDEECGTALEATTEIVEKIVFLPAKTLDELKIKARALLWCYSGRTEEVLMDFFSDMQNTTDTQLARSILRDLLVAI